MTIDEIKTALNNFKRNKLNFYLTFTEDKESFLNIAEREKLLRDNISVLLLRSNITSVGDFSIGGYIYNHFCGGEMAARLVNSIIKV
jgi:hypothetical protein